MLTLRRQTRTQHNEKKSIKHPTKSGVNEKYASNFLELELCLNVEEKKATSNNQH